MTKRLLIIFLIVSVFSSCKEDAPIDQVEPTYTTAASEPYSKEEFAKKLREATKDKNLDWQENSDAKLAYSAGYYTNARFTIGVKLASMDKDILDFIHQIDETDHRWQTAQGELVDIIRSGSSNNKVVKEMNGLPHFTALIYDLKTVKVLLHSEYIRYVEPTGDYYDMRNPENIPDRGSEIGIMLDEKFTAGSVVCSCGDPGVVNSSDYGSITRFTGQNYKIPWNYYRHGINDFTWDSYQGYNIGVAVLDTGIDEDQENLGADFNISPNASNRNLVKTNILGSSSHFSHTLG